MLRANGTAAALVMLALLVSCSTGNRRDGGTEGSSIIGLWEGVDHAGKPGSFHFFENGTVHLVIDGRNLGGDDPDVPFFLKYAINYAVDPVTLEIIGVDTAGVEYGKIAMIVLFDRSDQIRIITDFTETIPKDTEGNTFILDRLSE